MGHSSSVVRRRGRPSSVDGRPSSYVVSVVVRRPSVVDILGRLIVFDADDYDLFLFSCLIDYTYVKYV